MLENYNIENILFLDIETVPQYPDYVQLPSGFRALWDKKAGQLGRFDKVGATFPCETEDIYNRAGIYAEFGKIVCISTGLMRNKSLWIKSYSGDDERALLTEFSEMLNKSKEKKINYLCAHNGKEFDYPFIIRRLLINGLGVPSILDLSGKKPWEVSHLDTMEFWKFGDYKSYTSLELLAAVFGIPTPKDDIKGSDVARVYWQENDLARIVSYCRKDVSTIVNILLKFKGMDQIGEGSTQIMD
ncbi:MAG: ribonuclease H-like domain-containing protein [Bacteroidetes bacterium]|nr:ribonuclease H-like domain-containing protein [Bacteroidota bacterium]